MPSSKVITSIVLATVLVGGIIGFDLIKNFRETNTKNLTPEENFEVNKDEERISPNINISRNTDNSSLIDTDGDGLFDWEEELRGSDINNKDTDGDGTTDGDEVKADRNPLIKGPNDTLEQLSKTNTSSDFDSGPSNIIFTEGTLSERVSTNFISNYFNLGGGASLDVSTQEKLSNAISTDAAELAEIPDKYNILSIKTFPDYEKENIRRYGNDFASITIDYFALFSVAESPNDEVYINMIATLFENFGKSLAILPVPRGLVDAHLSFINNLNKTGVALRTLNESKRDPLNALFALGQYEEVGEEQPKLFVEIADYFEANDIIFSDGEFGIMWHNF